MSFQVNRFSGPEGHEPPVFQHVGQHAGPAFQRSFHSPGLVQAGLRHIGGRNLLATLLQGVFSASFWCCKAMRHSCPPATRSEVLQGRQALQLHFDGDNVMPWHHRQAQDSGLSR